MANALDINNDPPRAPLDDLQAHPEGNTTQRKQKVRHADKVDRHHIPAPYRPDASSEENRDLLTRWSLGVKGRIGELFCGNGRQSEEEISQGVPGHATAIQIQLNRAANALKECEDPEYLQQAAEEVRRIRQAVEKTTKTYGTVVGLTAKRLAPGETLTVKYPLIHDMTVICKT